MLPLRLAIAPRPRAGESLEQELTSWRGAGVDTIACLLEMAEIRELGLKDEKILSEGLGMRYQPFPIADRGIPASRAKAMAFADDLAQQLREGRGVVIHCRAGIGRSGVIGACVLMKLGFSHAEAFALLSAARGLSVPDTSAQLRWVKS